MASGVTKGSFWFALWRVLVWGLLAVTGCASSGAGTEIDQFKPGVGAFGQRCTKSEDCASGFCVRLDAQSGICSSTCAGASDCPSANNWACLPASSNASNSGSGLEVCACRLLGPTEVCGDGADNDCDGRVDDCRVCAGKPAPLDDPLNCGSCGTVCRGGHVCRDAKCQCPSGTLTECGADCVDIRSDARNCGGCDQRCPSAEVCRDGKCQCPDAKAGDYCEGVGCVDLATDDANCGTCGSTCPAGTLCRGGACVCPSQDRPDYCPGWGCVLLDSDAKHCGACDVSCKLGTRCESGTCACPAATPDFCNGVGCVDFAADRYNCGKCSNACPSGQSCQMGKCVCAGNAAPDYCDGAGCVDLKADAKNCGACGKVCPGQEVCTNGTCVCPVDRVLCNGGCIDVSSDPKNCGACGNACGSDQACVAGECGCSAFGYTTCGKQCVTTAFNPEHCGGCNVVCGANETCFHGTCLCASGLVCDGVCTPSDGLENCGGCGVICAANQYCAGTCLCQGAGLTPCGDKCLDLQTDDANCGACGHACPRGQACIFGSCGCAFGQTYCEASAACVNTNSDEGHCGTCEKSCKPTQVCQQGQCTCSNWTDSFCAETGACTSLYDNDAHCGACGHACPAGTHCASATCVCDQTGQSLCGSDCYDLGQDPQHCGSCDKACAAPMTCVAGGCTCPLPDVGAAIRITTSSDDDTRPSLAWDGTHAALAYARTKPDGSGELRIALLSADASVLSDMLVTAFDSAHWVIDAPSLVWTGSEYGLAWLQKRQDDARFDVELQRFSAGLVAKAPVLTVADGTSSLSAYSVSLAFGTGGYAIAYVDVGYPSLQDRLRFRKLGNDGTLAGATNSIPLYASVMPASASLAIAPDGSYAAAAGYPYGIIVGFFNSDGSRTAPALELLNDTNSPSPRPSMAYGGSNWLFTFSAGNAGDLVLNQGATKAYSPLVNAAGNLISSSVISVTDDVLSVVYTQPASNTSGDLIKFQRFKLATTGSPYVTALHAPINLLSTLNYATGGGFATTSVGPRRSLVAWSDNRWGSERELYAVVVDAGTCP